MIGEATLSAWLPVLGSLVCKSLLVFAAAAAALWSLRRASAALRHLVCLLTLAALLALPVLSLALPGWRLPISMPNSPPAPNSGGAGCPIPAHKFATLPSEGRGFGKGEGPASALALPSEGRNRPGTNVNGPGIGHRPGIGTPRPFPWFIPWLILLPALWLLGLLLACLRPLLGLWGIARLSRASGPVTDTAMLALADECASALRLTTTPILRQADAPVPMTWGGRHPVVLLPLDAQTWPEERLRAVLLHEMAHVRRRDWLSHRFADLVCALYWFHPFVWLTARRLRSESEIACDDIVLTSGLAAPDYARHLLEVARALRPVSNIPRAAIAMARTTRIEGRLKMILDPVRSRRVLTRRVLTATLGIGAAALIPLAMLRPAARAQAMPSPVTKPHMSKETARVSAVHAVPGEFDAMSLVGQGRLLTPQAAAGLERSLAAHPDDYAAHIQLLGYYGAKRFGSGPGKMAYRRQVLWFIRTHPESVLAGTPETMLLKRADSDGFEQGKALWLEQIAKQPKSTTLLGKAANYCVLSDNETAERLLRQAEALEPKNPSWPDKLGHLYQLQGNAPLAQDRRLWAGKALTEYEAAAALSTNKTLQHSTSADLAKTAFEAGDYDKARNYAEALLQRSLNKNGESFDPSDDIHQAHMILGRLALHDGDIAQARAHLLAMGRVSGSPVLSSFGPNMQLAKDLLDRGDRRTVLAYFDECAKFWTDDQGKMLNTWQAQVKKGITPNFGGNLYY